MNSEMERRTPLGSGWYRVESQNVIICRSSSSASTFLKSLSFSFCKLARWATIEFRYTIVCYETSFGVQQRYFKKFLQIQMKAKTIGCWCASIFFLERTPMQVDEDTPDSMKDWLNVQFYIPQLVIKSILFSVTSRNVLVTLIFSQISTLLSFSNRAILREAILGSVKQLSTIMRWQLFGRQERMQWWSMKIDRFYIYYLLQQVRSYFQVKWQIWEQLKFKRDYSVQIRQQNYLYLPFLRNVFSRYGEPRFCYLSSLAINVSILCLTHAKRLNAVPVNPFLLQNLRVQLIQGMMFDGYTSKLRQASIFLMIMSSCCCLQGRYLRVSIQIVSSSTFRCLSWVMIWFNLQKLPLKTQMPYSLNNSYILSDLFSYYSLLPRSFPFFLMVCLLIDIGMNIVLGFFSQYSCCKNQNECGSSNQSWFRCNLNSQLPFYLELALARQALVRVTRSQGEIGLKEISKSARGTGSGCTRYLTIFLIWEILLLVRDSLTLILTMDERNPTRMDSFSNVTWLQLKLSRWSFFDEVSILVIVMKISSLRQLLDRFSY